MRLRNTLLAATFAALCGFCGAAVAGSAADPTLSASARALVLGSQLTLSGVIPGAAAGADVQIMAQACGFTAAAPVGTTKTAAGGKYSYSFQPLLNSIVFVQVGTKRTNSTTIRISPAVQLRRIAARTFGVDVTSGNGAWFTKSVVLQRYDSAAKTWRPVASALLKANSTPDAIFAVSSATMHAAVKPGTRLRAIVPPATVGSCYLAAVSAPLVA
jgi:hypothetical protein